MTLLAVMLRRNIAQLEILPFLGLIQVPKHSFTAFQSSISNTNSNPFKMPASYATTPSTSSAPHVQVRNKLSKALLDIAFIHPPDAQISGKSALNEKDVPDSQEANEDEKPIAPAIKFEHDEQKEWEVQAEQEEGVTLEKLYLSDDDIGEYN